MFTDQMLGILLCTLKCWNSRLIPIVTKCHCHIA